MVIAFLSWVKDLIVVQSGDATMICHKDRAQEVKDLARRVSAASGVGINLVMPVYLGIDYGTKRMGLAWADELGVALPLGRFPE